MSSRRSTPFRCPRSVIPASLVPASLVLAGFVLAASLASAEEIKRLGSFGDWSVYALKEKAGTVCYIAGKPQKTEGFVRGRGDMAVLAVFPPAPQPPSVSIVSGYPYREDGVVTISVGRTSWDLLARGDRAWAPDSGADQAIVAAIAKTTGPVVVVGTSISGEQSTDTYSASGFKAALVGLNQTCTGGPKQDAKPTPGGAP